MKAAKRDMLGSATYSTVDLLFGFQFDYDVLIWLESSKSKEVEGEQMCVGSYNYLMLTV